MELFGLTVFRFLVPLTIFRFPLLGGLAAIGADALDWHILQPTTAEDYQRYQSWDKLLDLYYLTIEAYVASRFTNMLIRRISVLLFFYRLVGVLLFELLQFRFLLVIFPNLFESFYLFYLGYKKITKKELRFSLYGVLLLFLALLLPKVGQEYSQHILNEAPWYFLLQILHIFNR